MNKAPSKRVDLLDCGRLLAALTVVCFHYFYNGIRNGKIIGGEYSTYITPVAMYGYLGVDLFFMISGYVIFFSARGRSAREFAISRLVRILPAFWGAVIITTCVAQFIGTPETSVTLKQALANLTLYPNIFHQKFVDGVYWTLIYEVQFYALVGALLCTPLRRHLNVIALGWPFAIALTRLADHSNLPYLSTVHSFFAAGAVFAVLKTEKGTFAYVSLALALALCITDAMGNVADPGSPYMRSPLIMAAIIVAMFVFFGIADTRWGLAQRIPGAEWAGRMTYPIYLVHAHVGYMVLSHLGTSAIGYAVAFTFAFLLALALHLSVEVAMRDFWRQTFTKVAVTLTELLPAPALASLTESRANRE